MSIVVVTGGFDPIHSGHLALLKEAHSMGGILIVGINSDEWLKRKKGKAFMSFYERASVLRAIRYVDMIMEFDDSDNTAINCIRQVKEMFPQSNIIFANGGDRTEQNIPEMIDEFSDVEFVFGVGGEDKKNSSSWILKKWLE